MLGLMSEMKNFCSYAFVPLMGVYPEVFEKLTCNYIAVLSLGDLSKQEKCFDTAASGL